ncbi:hypothetical protein ASZ78_003425 [Callipepla squamata]|uniref:ADAMTS/ADAMTS-like Spacer 1 domain-containing protein n=1 Tax=Callipepla squamata TaxID=9009 RepID=A0A226NMC7_CALSU|nr:hypothetical protein ASZ78_003425 [Callipepla squamata]
MCSRTCGTGVRFRQRKCDNPPPGPGGKNCRGASVEHTVCENLPCPKGVPSFRDQQCQAHDRYTNKKKSLLTAVVVDEAVSPLYTLEEKILELNSQSEQANIHVEIHSFLINVLPSHGYFELTGESTVHSMLTSYTLGCPGTKIGCDGIIGSAAKEDRCGICSGDGKTCKVVKGDFNHTKGMGYIEAAVIPAGARRIRVVEDKPAHSFLGKKTKKMF